MTARTKYAPRRLALPAASMAAMLLAGCSSGNVGESWQCPLAKGGTCNSVAAADPAVPDATAAGRPLLREPLWRVRGSEPASQPESHACESDCDGGFDPFGWLMRLFADDDDVDPTYAREDGPAPATPASRDIPPSVKPESLPAEATAPAQRTKLEPDRPAAALPVEPASAEDDPDADDLRTGEVVARIWIAPFVDADGVYREASHVRVVLEPAGWRLPR